MGRPFEGHTELVSFRLSPDLIADIEEAGEEDGNDRSEQMRQLLRMGLAFREAKHESLRGGTAA